MIGVIADDLTGAAELGAVGLRHGLRAEIVMPGPGSSSWAAQCSQSARARAGNVPDLLCLTTESRSLPPARAALRAAAAARLLRTAGARWIYKKTDSVLRGQVTAELEAIMKELRCSRALLLPANPTLGRTIHNGRYFVYGQPVNRTDFARDPEYPRRSAKVLRLLAESTSVPIRVLQRDEAFSPSGIFIGEVSSSLDVKRWVARLEPDMLLAGGAETFGLALRAADLKPANRTYAKSVTPLGGELFVCGSASAACREFVDAARETGVPVIGLPEEMAWRSKLTKSAKAAVAGRISAAIRTDGRVILSVGLPPVRERQVARRLAEHLAELAAEVLSHGKVGHVFAEGGETAAALLRRMKWVRLKVIRELALGVATLEPDGGAGVWLTLKPGSYQWPASVTMTVRAGKRKFSQARSGQQKPESAK